MHGVMPSHNLANQKNPQWVASYPQIIIGVNLVLTKRLSNTGGGGGTVESMHTSICLFMANRPNLALLHCMDFPPVVRPITYDKTVQQMLQLERRSYKNHIRSGANIHYSMLGSHLL